MYEPCVPLVKLFLDRLVPRFELQRVESLLSVVPSMTSWRDVLEVLEACITLKINATDRSAIKQGRHTSREREGRRESEVKSSPTGFEASSERDNRCRALEPPCAS
jgi:hypothetical protein